MKIKYLFITLVSIGLFTGCHDAVTKCPECIECKQQTQYNLNNPEKIGVLNGRSLYRVKIVNHNTSSHYVYYFDGTNDNVMTINRTESQGKSTVNKVEVLIDGKPYIATLKDN